MKNNTNLKYLSCALASVIALSLSFSVNAEDMSLEEAHAEISRLEEENASLKQELELYEKHIAEHRAKLEEHDNLISELTAEQGEE